MGIWAVLPVKPFRRGKSRLSGVLSNAERTALNHSLLEHTLEILVAVKAVEHVLVVSRDPQVLSVARHYRAHTLMEGSHSNLNRSLEIGTAIIRRHAHRGILAVPADLPLLTEQDIVNLVSSANTPPVVAIAPDRHGVGTNGLFVAPAGLIPFTFGSNSFERHCEAARQAGARLEIVHSPSLALDLDLPEDLNLLRVAAAQQP
jgi:2-phospho-L-lactate guanylyltransferase